MKIRGGVFHAPITIGEGVIMKKHTRSARCRCATCARFVQILVKIMATLAVHATRKRIAIVRVDRWDQHSMIGKIRGQIRAITAVKATKLRTGQKTELRGGRACTGGTPGRT